MFAIFSVKLDNIMPEFRDTSQKMQEIHEKLQKWCLILRTISRISILLISKYIAEIIHVQERMILSPP